MLKWSGKRIIHVVGRRNVNLDHMVEIGFNDFWLGGNTYCYFPTETNGDGAEFIQFNKPAYVYTK